MKILAIGASNSTNSINKKFAEWAAAQVQGADVTLVDLNDYEMPLYSIDRERASGIPDLAKMFKELILESDGLVISFAEHNGSYSTAFKNVYDWISRLEKPIWANKPTLLLATSPGGRGGQTVLGHAMATLPYRGAIVASSFSLPFFSKNFDPD